LGNADVWILVAGSPDGTPGTSDSRSTPDPAASERNSMGIGFLLNGEGEKDFMNEFPKSTTLSPSSQTADFQALSAARNGVPGQTGPPITGQQAYPQHYGQIQLLPENNNHLDTMLRNLEFANFEQQPDNWQAPGGNMMLWSGADGIYLNRNVLEQRAFDIKEKLRYTANTMNVPHQPTKEVLDAIDHITAESIVVNLKLYFSHWHRHAPLVHEPTFNPCSAALPLVLALMSLGGMVCLGVS
jgi:hypothetical protein